VPGASSVVAAISAAGLDAAGFRFVGFVPHAARERARLLQSISASADATVMFEAPHRIATLLHDLARTLAPERRVVVARELTKKFESIRVQKAHDLGQAEIEERGEYVVIVDAAPSQQATALDDAGQRWLEALLDDLTPARASAIVSRITGVPRESVYELALSLRGKR
jgi:16S rRNA (cytidine1402-2'-O)-methyltransferase